ncbi:MAG: 3',5'-cyclic-nucleotide phosphodiesterase [Gammaproteobacteria bacterium]|nr:3',5'-cyclic-nucleotide phosphodiesterase [Gammaproteobacteria bacterium]
MKIRVLGCSGGIGAGLRTTSLLVDNDILLDAGTGVGDLSLEEMSHIKHLFITHSHLDHIVSLPLMVDSIFERLEKPITVYSQPETIKALKEHIFNWLIWPDFSVLPSEEKPVLKFQPVSPGDVIEIDGRQIEMIGVNHNVPAVGYRVQSDSGAFAFSGDTTCNDSLWDALNKHNHLDLLFVETAFTNRQINLAQVAHHYCPSLLAADLSKLKHRPEVYLTHLKPGEEVAILAEMRAAVQQFTLKTLVGGDVFTL